MTKSPKPTSQDQQDLYTKRRRSRSNVQTPPGKSRSNSTVQTPVQRASRSTIPSPGITRSSSTVQTPGKTRSSSIVQTPGKARSKSTVQTPVQQSPDKSTYKRQSSDDNDNDKVVPIDYANTDTDTSIASGGGKEEGIIVAVRMRPLNDKEDNHRKIWRVLPKHHSVTQTAPDGKPLTERIKGRNFFTFDKTFNESVSTSEVYASVAQDIVSSVVTGLNGTIFAYGQTSSGKTYTMQGAGSIKEGTVGGSGGGIVHMAANDIFNNISQSQDRIFLVRVSYLEIYNEEVRDLLASRNSPTLQIREDPRRGVFVQSKEEIVTDFTSLLTILFRGENNRQFASTAMNERSSRSHTIFRVTIESRKKNIERDNTGNSDSEEEESDRGWDDGAVLISTLNLVDLAGSESVRHTGATGDRQKEGGMINTSLLTLSRVIVALGTPNKQHINFRDSKLTRILQPSLSGNARMAVICCATPSEMYLEETRSTLAFATRAKLVKTRAQVNEVLDDQSTIKRLQRELAEARKVAPGSAQKKHLKALKQKADEAGNAAKEAEDKLDRLKRSILNSNVLFGNAASKKLDRHNRKVFGSISGNVDQSLVTRGKRRLSEGSSGFGGNTKCFKTTPERGTSMAGPYTIHKSSQLGAGKPLSPESEIELLREALKAKNNFIEELHQNLARSQELLLTKDSEIVTVRSSALQLEAANKQGQEELQCMSIRFQDLEAAHGETKIKLTQTQAERDQLVAYSSENQKNSALLQSNLDESIRQNESGLKKMSLLEFQLQESKTETNTLAYQLEECRFENQATKKDHLRLAAAMKEMLDSETTLTNENQELKDLLGLEEKNALGLSQKVRSLELKLSDSSNKISLLEQAIAQQTSEYNSSVKDGDAIRQELSSTREALHILKANVKTEKDNVVHLTSQLENVLEAINNFDPKLSPLEIQQESTTQQIEKLEKVLEEIVSKQNACCEGNKESIATLAALESQIAQMDQHISKTQVQCKIVHDSHISDKEELQRLIEKTKINANGQISALEEALENEITKNGEAQLCIAGLSEEHEAACLSRDEAFAAIHQLEKNYGSLEARFNELAITKSTLEAERKKRLVEIDQLQAKISSLEVTLDRNTKVCTETQGKNSELYAEKEQLESQLAKVVQEKNNLTISHEDLASRFEDLSMKNQQLQEHVDRLNAHTEDISTSLSNVMEEKAALESELETAVADIESAEGKLALLGSSASVSSENLAAATEKLACLESTIIELQNHKARLSQELDESSTEKASLLASLDECKDKVLVLQQQVLHAKEVNSDLQATVAATNEELSAVSEFRKSTLLAVQLLEERQMAANSNLQELTAIKNILAMETKEQQEENQRLQSSMEKLEESLQSHDSLIKESTESANALILQKESLEARLHLVTSDHERVISARDKLARDFNEVESRCELLENEIAQAKSFNEQEVSNNCSLKEEIAVAKKCTSQVVEEMQALRLSHSQTIESLQRVQDAKASLEHELKTRTAELLSQLEVEKLEKGDLMAALKQAQNDLSGTTLAHNKAQKAAQAFQEKQSSFNAELQELNRTKEALETSLAEIKNLNSKVEELEVIVKATESSFVETKNAVIDLEKDKSMLESTIQPSPLEKEELARVQKERDVALTSVRQLQTVVDEMKAEKHSIITTIQELKQANESDKLAIVSTTQNLEAVQMQKRDLEERLRQISQQLTEAVAEKKKAESQLFARDATILQLETNMDNHTSALLQQARDAAIATDEELTEKEREIQNLRRRLSECEEELEILLSESQTSSKLEQNNDSKLQENYESLQKDYDSLSKTLNKERALREESEKELKQTMGEEQRLLISEAEGRMSDLRDRISELENALNESESEAYAAREANEQLSLNAKRSENQLSQLESELNLLKERLFELNKTKKEQEAIQEKEITKLVSSVHTCKAEIYASKQTIMDLTARLRLSTSAEEIATREVGDLKAELKQMKANIEDKNAGEESIKKLQEKLQEKDQRIKKLEGVRLTKEQCAAIKKIKRDSVELKEKLRKTESDLHKAKKEIEGWRTQGQGPSHTEAQMTEIQSLLFDKKALEKKLRKYASHCQSLEDEKQEVADALAGTLAEPIVDGDIASAIVSLCDQCASLQEECATLKRLAQSEQNSFARCRELEKIVSELRQTLGEKEKSASTIQDGNQVKFLESENLNLMMDLKAARGQLQAARSEISALRLAALDDSPTRTLSRQPLTLTSGDNYEKTLKPDHSINVDAPNSPSTKENLTVHSTMSSHSLSTVASKKRSSSSTAGTEKTPKRNRRFPRMPGSGRTTRSSMKSAAPGLGEASRSDPEKEAAPECKQS